MPRKISHLIIDTDPGCDDCHALTHLLTLCDVIAITTVFGNTTQPETARNTCRILEMLGRVDVPVYNGARCSLQAAGDYIRDPDLSHYHGYDGLGDRPDMIPVKVNKQPELETTAPNAIINLVKKYPGEVTIAALGPLTNVAIATRLCPELPTLVKSLYIMGGSSVFGNITPWAEFNFHCDPLAAHLTVRHFAKSGIVHLVPWEPCMDRDNTLPFTQYESLFEGEGNSPAKKLLKSTGMNEWLEKRREANDENGLGYGFADQFVSLLIVYPESVLEKEEYDTLQAVCMEEKEEKGGMVEYLKGEGSGGRESGLFVYRKFDMGCMIDLYKRSMEK